MVLCPADETNNVLAEVTPCESCCQLLNSPFGAIPVNSLVAGCPSLAREISITPWLIRISFCSELTPASQWFIARNPFLSFRIISHFLILPRHCSEGIMAFLLGVKTSLLTGVISVVAIINSCKLDLLKCLKPIKQKLLRTHIEMIRKVTFVFQKKGWHIHFFSIRFAFFHGWQSGKCFHHTNQGELSPYLVHWKGVPVI